MTDHDGPTPSPANRYPFPLSGHRRRVAAGFLRIIALLLPLTGGAIPPSAIGGSITYTIVDYPTLQNGYTISGTITTNGSTGTVLPPNDITSWLINVTSNGTPIFSLDPTNSINFTASFDATPLRITATTPGDELGFTDNQPMFDTLQWYGPTQLYIAAFKSTTIWSAVWDPSAAVAVVPEPSAFLLLAVGALGAGAFIARGWSRHRRPIGR